MTGYQSKRAAAQDKVTHMTQEALKLALEALKEAQTNDDGMEKWDRNKKAITAINQALAQPEQKPVAWMSDRDVGFKKSEFGATPTVPLYTTPPQRPWVGLTAEEAAKCWTTTATQTWKNFEAALKEKNNGFYEGQK